jgi:hypothetical protein
VTSDELFGESQLLTDAAPASETVGRSSGTGALTSALSGWTSHLQCVDEALMLRVWRRMLADEAAVSAVLSDTFLRALHPAVNQRLQVPSDTNPSFLARTLVECSDGNRFLPLADSPLHVGQVRRLMGSVSSFRATSEGWTVRVTGSALSSVVVRFNKEAFLSVKPRGMQGTKVLGLGIVDDARTAELSGIALLIQTPVGDDG